MSFSNENVGCSLSLARKNVQAAWQQLATALNFVNVLKKRGLINNALAQLISEETEGLNSSLAQRPPFAKGCAFVLSPTARGKAHAYSI